MEVERKSGRIPTRYQPPRPKVPAGLAASLPVSTAQEIFRQNVASTSPSLPPRPGPGSSPPLGSSLLGNEILFNAMMNRRAHESERQRGALVVSPHAPSPALLPPVAATRAAPSGPIRNSAATPGAERGRRSASVEAVAAADGGNAALRKAIADAERYITNELAILGDGAAPVGRDAQVGEASAERLAVFRSAYRSVTPLIPPPLHTFLERLLLEHDRFIHTLECAKADQSMLNERRRLEEHYERHYLGVAESKERDIEKKRRAVDAAEAGFQARLRTQENQIAALREENVRLRTQQNEDHDRLISMAQSVVDSRLAAQRAEIIAKEAEAENERIRMAQKQHLDLVSDFMDMMKIIKSRGLTFEPRCKFVIDSMLAQR